jgi:hypothetical protein
MLTGRTGVRLGQRIALNSPRCRFRETAPPRAAETICGVGRRSACRRLPSRVHGSYSLTRSTTDRIVKDPTARDDPASRRIRPVRPTQEASRPAVTSRSNHYASGESYSTADSGRVNTLP